MISKCAFPNCSANVRLGHEVITIEHVEEVINRMGKPEEIFEEEETEEEKENAKNAFSGTGYHRQEETDA